MFAFLPNLQASETKIVAINISVCVYTQRPRNSKQTGLCKDLMHADSGDTSKGVIIAFMLFMVLPTV